MNSTNPNTPPAHEGAAATTDVDEYGLDGYDSYALSALQREQGYHIDLDEDTCDVAMQVVRALRAEIDRLRGELVDVTARNETSLEIASANHALLIEANDQLDTVRDQRDEAMRMLEAAQAQATEVAEITDRALNERESLLRRLRSDDEAEKRIAAQRDEARERLAAEGVMRVEAERATAELRAENARLREVLQGVEYVAGHGHYMRDDVMESFRACPVCYGAHPGFTEPETARRFKFLIGHSSTCEMAAALKGGAPAASATTRGTK